MDIYQDQEVWFVTGSQHLYGPEALEQVAANAQVVVEGVNASGKLPDHFHLLRLFKQRLGALALADFFQNGRVRLLQFRCALTNAIFQHLVKALQLVLRPFSVRDVRGDSHQAGLARPDI